VTEGSAALQPVVGVCRACGQPIEIDWEYREWPRHLCSDCRADSLRLPMAHSLGRSEGLPDVLRRLMTFQGHTIRGLARYITAVLGVPVSATTIGAWQSGRSLPTDPLDSAALRALELALDLELGDLALLFPPREPATQRTSQRPWPTPVRPLTDYAAAGSRGTDLQQTFTELQAAVRAVTGSQRVIVVELDSHHHVGTDRRRKYSRTKLTVRAMHDLVDCYWFLHAFTCNGTATVRPLDNCQAVRDLREGPLNAVELVFPKTLSRGDYHTFAFAVDYEYDDDDREPRDEPPFFARAIPIPLETAGLHVSFDAPPQDPDECQWDLHDIDPARPIARRRLRHGIQKASQYLKAPKPAAYGWTWTWPPETLDNVEKPDQSSMVATPRESEPSLPSAVI
jgi:hypothetical protein